MDKHSPGFYNAILAIGMIFIIAGFLLFVLFFESTAPFSAVLLPILLMICGAVFLFFTMSFTGSSLQLFLGLLLGSSGVFSLLFTSNLIPYGLAEWWPLFIIFAALSLLASGFYRYRRMLLAYMLPFVTLFVLGSLFLFFSFHVIPVSFRMFVAFAGPFLLIACGIFMVLLFMVQCKFKKFKVHDELDEISGIDDDTAASPGQGENR